MLIGRRSLLIAPFAGAVALSEPRRVFAHDHVLGTSMELIVRGRCGSDADAAALSEIARVSRVVSTYDPASEISRWRGGRCSSELSELLNVYEEWSARTGGVVSAHSPAGALNVDALGKAFVMRKALAAARRHSGSALLNIGGDIVAAGGETWTVGVADPARPHDSAAPLTTIALRDAAVATSGSYERGAHLYDPRTGQPANTGVSATVLARDIVTANALATALCVLDDVEGLRLVNANAGAECLILRAGAAPVRSAGFGAYERPFLSPAMAESDWAPGCDLIITLTLKPPQSFGRRPYVAVWAEDEKGKVVRNIAVWASRPRWFRELHSWWADNSGGDVASMTRATRPPGRYKLVWDGLSDKNRPVPAGEYTILVESNREHGNYAKESAKIACGTAKQSAATILATSEFEAVALEYGPRTQTA